MRVHHESSFCLLNFKITLSLEFLEKKFKLFHIISNAFYVFIRSGSLGLEGGGGGVSPFYPKFLLVSYVALVFPGLFSLIHLSTYIQLQIYILYNIVCGFNCFLYFYDFCWFYFLCLIFCILDIFGLVVGWNEYMYIFDGQYMPDMGVRFIWPKWQLRAESRGAGIDCWHIYLEPISPLITGSTNRTKLEIQGPIRVQRIPIIFNIWEY